MKQFIVLIGILPLVLVFVLQMGLDQRNNKIIDTVQACTYTAKEQAKQEGCFSKELKENLTEEISLRTGIDESKIHVYGDEQIRYRYGEKENRLIRYRVEVEIENVMAANRFMGISDSDNRYVYAIDSYTASERL